MRLRVGVLACTLAAIGAALAPGVAGAAPRHNHHLTIAAVPDPIAAGEGVLIYGQLEGADSAGQRIFLYHRINPQPFFSLIGTTVTNQFGFYEFTRAEGVVVSNRSWFVRGPGGAHSRTVHERVAALVSLASNTMTANTGQPVVFSGHVTPDHPFQPVRLQQQNSLAGNGWSTIATTFTNGGSNFALSHRFKRPGDYTLRALVRGDARNITGESDSVTVEVQQKQNPTFTINSSSPIITEGGSVTISGVLYKPGSTTPGPLTSVTLYGKQAGSGFEALATTTTGPDGSYNFSQTPVYNMVYKVETTLKPHRATADLYQGVQDMVMISSSSPATTDGGSVTISGTVSPNKAGHAIYLQRMGNDGNWHDVALGVVTSTSTYSFTYTFGQMGTFQLRARIYGDPDNIGAASQPVTVTVSGVAPVTSLPPAS